MNPTQFEKRVEQDRVIAAIQATEKLTTGELRVFISRKPVVEPVAAAAEAFLQLGMDKTRQRNGVLIFVAPESQNFAIIGDSGVNAKCGEDFWKELVGELPDYFRKGEFTGGIVHAVNKVGAILARHFPPSPDDKDELPNTLGEA